MRGLGSFVLGSLAILLLFLVMPLAFLEFLVRIPKVLLAELCVALANRARELLN